MHKLMAPLALMLAVSFTAPADVSAKDGSGKSNNAGQSKEYKNETEKADDKGGKGRGKDDDRIDDKGGGIAGSDDQLKTCYVFTSGGKLPRPVQHYITKGDEMRLLAADHMKRLAGMIYYDDTVRYPEKADDPKSYNPRYDLYSRDDRLGRKACVLF